MTPAQRPTFLRGMGAQVLPHAVDPPKQVTCHLRGLVVRDDIGDGVLGHLIPNGPNTWRLAPAATRRQGFAAAERLQLASRRATVGMHGQTQRFNASCESLCP